MATIDHAPIQHALNRVRQLSADEEAQRLAFVRERAVRDEVSFLKAARREGLQQGLEEGLQQGRQQGRQQGQREASAAILLQLLTLKFGTPPETIQQRVQQAEANTLHDWTARVLTAQQLNDIFR